MQGFRHGSRTRSAAAGEHRTGEYPLRPRSAGLQSTKGDRDGISGAGHPAHKGSQPGRQQRGHRAGLGRSDSRKPTRRRSRQSLSLVSRTRNVKHPQKRFRARETRDNPSPSGQEALPLVELCRRPGAVAAGQSEGSSGLSELRKARSAGASGARQGSTHYLPITNIGNQTTLPITNIGNLQPLLLYLIQKTNAGNPKKTSKQHHFRGLLDGESR